MSCQPQRSALTNLFLAAPRVGPPRGLPEGGPEVWKGQQGVEVGAGEQAVTMSPEHTFCHLV